MEIVDRKMRARWDRNLHLIGKVSGKKILDIGCETGLLSSKLAADNEVHGIDANWEVLQLAAQRNLKTTCAEIEGGLPFDSDFFDIVIAAEILEHVFDTDFVLSEIRRVLNVSGIFLISVPNVNSLTSRIMVPFGKLPGYTEYYNRPGTAGHIRAYNLRAIKGQLADHDFKIEDVRTSLLGIGRCSLNWPWRFPVSLGENMIIKARKTG